MKNLKNNFDSILQEQFINDKNTTKTLFKFDQILNKKSNK